MWWLQRSVLRSLELCDIWLDREGIKNRPELAPLAEGLPKGLDYLTVLGVGEINCNESPRKSYNVFSINFYNLATRASIIILSA